MRIFISFAHEQSRAAESIYRKLLAARYDVFFASDDIRASDGYDDRIRREVDAADRMIFLASSEALAEGKFTLTELGLFSRKWPDPTGRVMAVLLGDVSYADLPPYLGGVTSALKPKGDVSSDVVAAVLERWPLRKWRPVFAGAIGLSIMLGLGAWVFFALGGGGKEGNMTRVRVTLDQFTVHKDADIPPDGDGDFFWALEVNNELVSELPRDRPKEMGDGHTELLKQSKEFDLEPDEKLILKGHISDMDGRTRDDVVLFDENLPIPSGKPKKRKSRKTGPDGTPDVELFYTVELVDSLIE